LLDFRFILSTKLRLTNAATHVSSSSSSREQRSSVQLIWFLM